MKKIESTLNGDKTLYPKYFVDGVRVIVGDILKLEYNSDSRGGLIHSFYRVICVIPKIQIERIEGFFNETAAFLAWRDLHSATTPEKVLLRLAGKI